VDHAALVGITQGRRHIASDAHGFGYWKLPFAHKAVTKRLALDIGHDVVGLASVRSVERTRIE
jgi:hypothetical protein